MTQFGAQEISAALVGLLAALFILISYKISERVEGRRKTTIGANTVPDKN